MENGDVMSTNAMMGLLTHGPQDEAHLHLQTSAPCLLLSQWHSHSTWTECTAPSLSSTLKQTAVMVLSRATRRIALTLSNILIPLAVLVFASGFFPYKPVLPGLATFEDVQEHGAGREAAFDRVIFMVVDALRSDFVYGYNSGFEFTQSLIRSGAAIPFTAHAAPPTVTMPRVKALTTGSVPSFLDLILNFAESDTTSSLATQDTWLAQIKASNGHLVFYGDDTWLKLFPGEDFFARADGTSSFFVSDFTEVDLNVTRHVPSELAREDWKGMIMHYLGLDHIGHKTGPQGPNMLPKQREMDGIVRMIFEAMTNEPHHAKTLLVVAGDHGMNAGGNHGGSGPGETEPALLFASPLFRTTAEKKEYECPTLPKEGTEFHYYTKIEQSDILPVLAGLMGLPISKNSLGVFPPELMGLLTREERVRLLRRNARQILEIVRAKFGGESFDGKVRSWRDVIESGGNVERMTMGDEEKLACEWARILLNIDSTTDTAEQDLYTFLTHAQEAMSDTASSYDISRMVTGILLITLALTTALLSFPTLSPPSTTSIFLTVLCILYGTMMFASSYVEEEQHFWYWLTPAWIAVLITRDWSQHADIKPAAAGAILLLSHRLAIRWNQTGQKHAGEPDIVHTVFPEHHIVMWLLILSTYLMEGGFLHLRTFDKVLMMELATFAETAVIFLGAVFKLNFTQADAPELVRGLATKIREASEPFGFVLQARAVFALLAVSVVIVVLVSLTWMRLRRRDEKSRGDEEHVPLPERLHYLLTLFLMTQTRAPNIPLYLLLELQRRLLSRLLTPSRSAKSGKLHPSPLEVATTVLLLSHTYYFCMGGSNSISSIDLSNAYNGVADYNIAAVGVLLFASNWAGPIWWCSAGVLLCLPKDIPPQEESKASRKVKGKDSTPSEAERDWVIVERQKLHAEARVLSKSSPSSSTAPSVVDSEAWAVYISVMTIFVATGLLAVMAACTALRTHLFIWTVFSPKYLYAMAWAVGWHLLVNIGFGGLLWLARWVV